MRKCFFYFMLLFFWACKESGEKYPVYKVDLDHPDQLQVVDLFSKVEAIPLETTEKSRFISGELGVKGERYYILDKNQQLFFCFDTTGKFRYVLDNKPKGKKKKAGPNFRSVLNPYSYYYQKKWYYYLTFRNVVYNKDKQGKQTIAYMWDFGDYNDDKEIRVQFPPLPPRILVPIQQAWLKANNAFALTNARQAGDYIYTLVERMAGDSVLPADQRFYHLFCYKPTGRCYYFNSFSDDIPLSSSFHLAGRYLLMLLPFQDKGKYENLDLLDGKSRKILSEMTSGDNPVILKCWFKEMPG